MSPETDWTAAQLEGVRAAIYDTIIPRRERIAETVLQGYLIAQIPGGMEELAHYAIKQADALIAELDKEIEG